MTVPRTPQHRRTPSVLTLVRDRAGVAALLAALAFAVSLLDGCGSAGFGTATAVATAPVNLTSGSALKGTAHGGRSPIAGATIQLWQTGTSAYGAASTTPLATTTTAGDGTFFIASFTCTPGTQLYLTSMGGNPGAGINTYVVMLAGLTSCSNAASLTFVNIDEVTTVASAYALQAFASTTQSFASGVQIGAPASNQAGLALAMADVATLVTLTTGEANTGGTGLTLPFAEINTLANALAQCVNSASTDSRCAALSNAAPSPSGSAPQDTLASAFNIARTAGGAQVATLVALGGGSSVPFTPVLATTPSDLTLGVTYSGGGIHAPAGLAVDGSGNVWIANSTGGGGTGSVTELSHTGTVLSGAAGFTAGSLNAPSSLAVDPSGNIWVANAGNSTLTELTASGTNAAGSPFSGGGLSTPASIAIDGAGLVWVANSGNNSISEFKSNGAAVSGPSGYTASGLLAPVAVAIDPH